MCGVSKELILARYPRFGAVSMEYIMYDDIVEAHCYFVDIGRTDREQIRSRINNNDCRTFRPRRPLSTAYRVLYAVDKGLRGRNVLQSRPVRRGGSLGSYEPPLQYLWQTKVRT